MEEKDENINSSDEDSQTPPSTKQDDKNESEKKTELNERPEEKVKNKSQKKRRTFWILAILVAVILAVAIGSWYFVWGKDYFKTESSKTTEKPKQKVSQNTETDPQIIKFIAPNTGEKWLDKPVKIAKQGYFKYMPKDYYAGESLTDYYEVGSRGENKIIMANGPGVVGGNIVYLYEKSPKNEVVYISHPSDTAVYNSDYQSELPQYSVETIKLASDIHYDSLSVPDKITIDKKGNFVSSSNYSFLGEVYSAPKSTYQSNVKETEIKKLGRSTLYKYESTSYDTGLVSVSYFIKSPINTRIEMEFDPLDLSLKKYKWQFGYANSTDSLHAVTRGCGTMSASVTRSDEITDADVIVAGKSAKGLTVYGIKDKNNTLLQKALSEYNQFVTYDSNLKQYTADEFIKEHGLVLYKDTDNQWLVYVRGELAPAGGCAKPVVYLYPRVSQWVNVRVGADVKISDPLYDSIHGWRAYAQPNGQLTVNGSSYSSLFWEGPGYGRYPEVNEGTVVKKRDAIKTIEAQLLQQGLNDNEISDFVDYWKDKLPNKPYIRLTWFDTQQMDELAPLYISPKPDTAIRVFLDSSGLDSPIDLPKQKLHFTARNGFTVVEWGGLPHHKLY
jgi:hypothetical protein